MKTRIFHSNQHLAFGRISHARSRNDWLISHRLGPQGQQTQNAGWAMAAVAVTDIYGPPATAAASIEDPVRRQRAAENNWENEGGTTRPPMRAPGYGERGE